MQERAQSWWHLVIPRGHACLAAILSQGLVDAPECLHRVEAAACLPGGAIPGHDSAVALPQVPGLRHGRSQARRSRVSMDPAVPAAPNTTLGPGRLARLRQLQHFGSDALSGHELVARSLAALGFTWIAGVGGTPVHPIFRDCVRMGLLVLGTRTQAGATLMTAASAYVAGRQTGAVVLSAGPAVTNAITGILVARDNGWPLLVLGGRRAIPDDPGAFQQLDAATLLQPIAKWTACARTPGEIPRLLHEAVRIARSGRPGPVYIDLPENVLSASTEDPGPLPSLIVEPALPEPRHGHRLAERLRQARSPVLVLGDRTRWHVDCSQVVPWLERLEVPVISLPLMRRVLAERHPWAVRGTEARARALGQADLVVLFGADLDWRLRFGAEIRRDASLVLVDATPDPPCRQEERQEWVAADPGLLLNQLAGRLPVRYRSGSAPPPLPEPRPSLNRGAVNEGSAPPRGSISAGTCRLPHDPRGVRDHPGGVATRGLSRGRWEDHPGGRPASARTPPALPLPRSRLEWLHGHRDPLRHGRPTAPSRQAPAAGHGRPCLRDGGHRTGNRCAASAALRGSGGEQRWAGGPPQPGRLPACRSPRTGSRLPERPGLRRAGRRPGLPGLRRRHLRGSAPGPEHRSGGRSAPAHQHPRQSVLQRDRRPMSRFSPADPAPCTVLELLHSAGGVHGGEPVLLDPAGTPLERAGLVPAIDAVWRVLAEHGVGRTDRVALAMAPGPLAAVALLGTMARAVAAPLNPQAPESAHRADLRRLEASLVLTDAQSPPALLSAAESLGLSVCRLPSLVSCRSSAASTAAFPSAPAAQDLALLLQTSGTTATPKLVPLSHANLLASARHVAEVLQLTPADRSLAVMPLFHIHGIVASLLAPLLSGGSVICSEPLPGDALLALIGSSKPTWLSAVPTLLQSLAAACGPVESVSPQHTLRLIRSSSAPLAPALARRLEAVFGVPVIEAYGMTEAAHQICSNRLPPGPRFPGSVGVAAGPEVAVLGAGGQLLPPGQVGEVAIRGANVTVGYPGELEGGWVTGGDGRRWFPTGDEGSIDAHGVLRLTGRLKEMINRGGEKVVPREVDEALMEHPGVEQAIAFAVPHPTLGEDVAAAVVLAAGLRVTEEELRSHCFARLAPHQVPTRIVLVDAVPKGPTGKLQRIGLAATLEHLLQLTEQEPPRGEVEELVGQVFAAVLGIPVPSRDSNFFALGGDSLTGMRVISRLNGEIPLNLPATLLFRHPTLRLLAAELEQRIEQALAALKESQPGP